MNSERIKEIQAETAYPQSRSVQQALLKVWNECEQEQNKNLFSEEEVKFMLYNCCESLEEDERRFFNTDLTVESIIKQFKKK